LLTTNHVVAETITLARMAPPRRHSLAVRIGEFLYGERMARIYWATPEDEMAAFEYLKRFRDKSYSFVDSLSFVVMEKFGLQEAFTLDSDFSHRFIVRPRLPS
jgi:predicted nucleic acid-binding protein